MYLSPTLLLFPVLGPIQVQTKAQLRENERMTLVHPSRRPLGIVNYMQARYLRKRESHVAPHFSC